MKAWNHWYHCMGNTYGTWLPGDPRGFRTRHHREHVDGDYKNPPPRGKYEKRLARAKSLMKRDPLFLSSSQRKRAVDEFVKSFRKWDVEVLAVSIDSVHFHVLARFPRHNPRRFLGLAKKESSAYMKRDDQAPDGGLWAVKCECKPVNNRSHQLRVFGYILDHRKKGAAFWNFLKAAPPKRSDDFTLDDVCLLLGPPPAQQQGKRRGGQ